MENLAKPSLFNVFQNLSGPSILYLCRVNKTWASMCNSQLLFKFLLERDFPEELRLEDKGSDYKNYYLFLLSKGLPFYLDIVGPNIAKTFTINPTQNSHRIILPSNLTVEQVSKGSWIWVSGKYNVVNDKIQLINYETSQPKDKSNFHAHPLGFKNIFKGERGEYVYHDIKHGNSYYFNLKIHFN